MCLTLLDVAQLNILSYNIHFLKIKVKVKQSSYRPGMAQRVLEVKVPTFRDNGTGWW